MINLAVGGDQEAWARLLGHYRDRLRRMVIIRLDPRVQGRLDPSDVIQEAYLEAIHRLPTYVNGSKSLPFYLWLRFLVGQKVLEYHRKHLGAQARNSAREVSLYRGPMPLTSSDALAGQLLGRHSSPSEVAIRAERKLRLQEVLNQMEPVDREILVLRHFEELSNKEVALVLGLDKAAASKRYARALMRLKTILASTPGGLQEP